MNLLKPPGESWYAVFTLLAFIGGLFVSAIVTFGLAFGTAGFADYLMVLIVNLATLCLFVGLLGNLSRRKSVVVGTTFGAALVPTYVAYEFLPELWTRHEDTGGDSPLVWKLLLVVDIVEVFLACMKLHQLRELREANGDSD